MSTDSSIDFNDEKSDPYLWLEQIQGVNSIGWAKQKSTEAFQELKSLPRFATLEKDIRKILLAKDRVPGPSRFENGWIYNFWEDEKNPKGLWRRAKFEEYLKKDPKWEILLDVDKLAKEENENWVFHGANCLSPQGIHCLISLSRGGKDAAVVREFDLTNKIFVKNGFNLPEAKTSVRWIDQDQVFLGTDLGPESLTESGYPKQVRLWKRGEDYKKAPIIFDGDNKDFWNSGYTLKNLQGQWSFIYQGIGFFESRIRYFENGKLTLLDLPAKQNIVGMYKGRLIFLTKQNWKVKGQDFKEGSLLSADLKKLLHGEQDIEVILEPTPEFAIRSVQISKSYIWVQTLKNVQSELLRLKKTGTDKDAVWLQYKIELPKYVTADFVAVDDFSDDVFVAYSNFLQPWTYSFLKDGSVQDPKIVKKAPVRFDSSGLVVSQRMAKSKDGTEVPYFLVHNAHLKMDGKNPTWLYAYGGFDLSILPSYSGVMGKAWLEKGGVYVLANIRGGGELGPRWHQAALKTNRNKSYEDFIAIAQDLIDTKVTSKSHLGISGGSNGGLLVTAVMALKPELFKAVISAVPLTDMFRFHKLLAGASWVAEYGNTELDAEVNSFWRKYSPYQNVKKDIQYPRLFLHTSTLDDRVHPGHARKLAAKMKDQGHQVLYYENTEGGHGAAADTEQRIRIQAMEYSFMAEQLGLNPQQPKGNSKGKK